MITYVDSKNSQNYTVLFEKASAKLGLAPFRKEVLNPVSGEMETVYWRRYQEGGVWKEVACEDGEVNDLGQLVLDGKPVAAISSLNEYFQHIEDLAKLAIGDGRGGSEPYLLRLPLDEPFMEINANTRAITVPAALRQIGVVGDKFAEIIFFEIDRYFDAVDLDTRQIYIEWEAPDGAGGVRKGVSRDFLKDTQSKSKEGKIIFGWLIGDELTKNVGTIRFAVRFVEWTDMSDSANKPESGTGLLYSFSSLPAQINVVESLNYDLFEDSENAEMIKTDDQARTILFFLENSNPDTADETTPDPSDKPVFVRNLGQDEATTVIQEADLNDDGQLKLVVEAYVTDGGSISYMFARREGADTTSNALPTKIDFEEKELTSISDDDNTLYYVIKGNGIAEPVTKEEIQAMINVDGKANVSEKIAYTVATLPGYYYARARNSAMSKKTSSQDSNMLYIPYAEAPTINSTMPEKFVIKETEYKVEVDETIDQTKREFADKSNLKITAGEPGDATIVLGNIANGPTFSAEKTKGLTYTWYKADNAEMADAEVVGSEPTFEVTEPGYYAVAVDNFYNNDHKAIEKDAAGVIRVTAMPTLPTVSWSKWESVIPTGAIEDIEISEVEHDKVTYEWHKVTSALDEDPIAANEMANATGELTFIDGVAKIPFKPLAEGDYYFILCNELNGAKIYYSSALEYGMIIVKSNGGNVNPQPPVDDGGNTDSGNSDQTQDGGEVTPENPDIINDGGDEGNND